MTIEREFSASYFRALDPDVVAEALRSLSDEDSKRLFYDWEFWRRDEQTPPPGDWITWLILAGRGFGKTRTAAEWVRAKAESVPGCRIALVNDTAADTRDVMVEGASGIIAISPPWFKPVFEPSKRRVTWPNGSRAILYAAEAPDLLRGPEHHFAWCDEPAKWKNLRKRDIEGGTAWDNLMMGLRAGAKPQCVASTTPRPIKWVKDIVSDKTAVVTRGSSYDNRANLPDSYFSAIISKYEGTRLGRQELNAEILEDNPNALWSRDLIERNRMSSAPCAMRRIVVSVDPAVTSHEDSDETGIIVAGLGMDGRGYVLDDRSISDKPEKWARRVVETFHEFKCDRIIGEVNNGGDLIEAMLRVVDRTVPFKAVHASRGKVTRAEPISAMYEKGLVSHVGFFPYLEDQMADWNPASDQSPDRIDALVWALWYLFKSSSDGPAVVGERTFGRFTM